MSDKVLKYSTHEPHHDQDLALLPFAEWAREGDLRLMDGSKMMAVSRPLFMALLRPKLRKIKFDASYYRRANPDLLQAETAGIVKDLHEHYIEFGYFESRLPSFVEVDGAFYGREYPDVAVGVLERTVKSAQWHFETIGFKEGRLPRRGWSFSELIDSN
ncbi:hypothetical protein [Siccirubricoccus sp. G192]|uniref:hypothetical protein n=1 Tax=Siccirubricoccus sp. G192 TaxID=2849651 RepID=UPI001C2C1F4C|nr:hypothetical protein [Siccirubricoccus sp. G192]MBV1797733.1 hypothetical protein [Siccirubricoccus sp. G192]